MIYRGGINGYTRHSELSIPTSSVTEKDQTDHHMVSYSTLKLNDEHVVSELIRTLPAVAMYVCVCMCTTITTQPVYV